MQNIQERKCSRSTLYITEKKRRRNKTDEMQKNGAYVNPRRPAPHARCSSLEAELQAVHDTVHQLAPTPAVRRFPSSLCLPPSHDRRSTPPSVIFSFTESSPRRSADDRHRPPAPCHSRSCGTTDGRPPALAAASSRSTAFPLPCTNRSPPPPGSRLTCLSFPRLATFSFTESSPRRSSAAPGGGDPPPRVRRRRSCCLLLLLVVVVVMSLARVSGAAAVA